MTMSKYTTTYTTYSPKPNLDRLSTTSTESFRLIAEISEKLLEDPNQEIGVMEDWLLDIVKGVDSLPFFLPDESEMQEYDLGTILESVGLDRGKAIKGICLLLSYLTVRAGYKIVER
jgi:hypothetical protein